jgi:hypothetical protein
MDFFSLLQHLTSSAVPGPLNALSRSQGGTNMLVGAGQPQADLANTFPAPPQVDWLSGVRGQDGAGPNGSAAYQNGLQTAFANSPPMPATNAGASDGNAAQRHEKSPLQRAAALLMQTHIAPLPRPQPFVAPNGNALLDYMQNSPFLRQRRPF